MLLIDGGPFLGALSEATCSIYAAQVPHNIEVMSKQPRGVRYPQTPEGLTDALLLTFVARFHSAAWSAWYMLWE